MPFEHPDILFTLWQMRQRELRHEAAMRAIVRQAAASPPHLRTRRLWGRQGSVTSRTGEMVVVYDERQAGRCEDAPPLAVVRNQVGLLAAFDGLGGAGASRYEDAGAAYTGAYLASRLARETLAELFSESVGVPGGEAAAAGLAGHVRDALASAFAKRLSALVAVGPRLKGRLLRQLPTTMAAVLFDVAAHPPEPAQYTVLWAGDTRAYVLDAVCGLQQLSIDDLVTGDDAFANLADEAPLANCICAGSAFVVNVNYGSQPLPAVFLVATDGCFQYFPSPAHFEFALLDTLAGAHNGEDWGRRLRERIRAVTGDDFTLALMGVGFADFTCLARAFATRRRFIESAYIRPVAEIASATGAGAAGPAHVCQTLWGRYKPDYTRQQRRLEGRGAA